MSISNDVEYQFKCEKCGKEVKTKIQLVPLINKINHFKYPFVFSDVERGCIVTCDLPTVASELAFEEVNVSPFDFSKEDHLALYTEAQKRDLTFYIKEISILSSEVPQIVNMNNLSFKAKCELIEKLPAKLLSHAWAEIQTIKEATNIPLLATKCVCGASLANIHLMVNTPAYSAFLKSIFNENPQTIYQNIYYMSSIMKLSAEYIEELTPGERDMFWGFYNKDKKERQLNAGQDLEDLAVDNPESGS